MNQNIKNIENCPRSNNCSINVCPLDPDAILRKNLPSENPCPYCLKKKNRSQKGIKTLAPDSVLEVIAESNVKMLNNRNQRRWSEAQIAKSNKRLL